MATLAERLSRGLGRVSDALLPMNPQAAGVDPQYAEQLRSNAMLQMGLGMVAAGRAPGGTIASGLAAGLGRAGTNLNEAMQTAYQNARAARADDRADTQEQRLMDQAERAQAHQQWLESHTLEREKTQDERYNSEQEFRLQQANQEQKRWEAEQKAQADWRKDQIAARGDGKIPIGYRLAPDGNLEYVPGGPADPKTGERTVKPTEGNLASANYLGRMERAETLLGGYTPSMTDYAAAIRLYGTEDAGMLSTAAANNIISEGGQKYYQAAADWVRAKLRKESGAVISPSEMAQEIRTYFPVPGDSEKTIQQKAEARSQAADGMRNMAGVAAPAKPAPQATQPSATKSIGGKSYVQIDGQWYEDDGTPPGQ